MNTPADLVRIVIDETDWFVIIYRAVISYRPNDHLPGVTRPIDQNLLPSADLPDGMIKTTGQPSPSHKENQQQRVDDENRQGIASEVEDPMHQNIKYDRARRNRGDNVPKVPDTGVSPESFVKLERNKNYPRMTMSQGSISRKNPLSCAGITPSNLTQKAR